MEIQKKVTHVADALNFLVEEFKNSTNLKFILSAFVQQIQELENVYYALYTERWIDSAIGAQLDIIGALVGEDRQSKSDDDYRDAIKVRIGINRGHGTAPDMIDVVRGFFESMVVNIVDYYPASFTVRLIDPIPVSFDADKLKNYIRSVKPLGVHSALEFFVEGPFQYDTGLGYDQGKYAGAV